MRSVVFGLSQKHPNKCKAAYWLCGSGVAPILADWHTDWRSVGKLLPAPETIGLMPHSRQSYWGAGDPGVYKTAPHWIRDSSACRAACLPPFPVAAAVAGVAFAGGLLARGKIMGNSGAIIIGIALLSAGNLFDAPRRRASLATVWRCRRSERCSPDAATEIQRYAPSRWRPPFTEGDEILPGNGAPFLGLASPYF